MRGAPTRTVVVAGLLVALLLAGAASYYASGAPDGLVRVAQETGLAEREEASPTRDSPLAGYETRGVEDGRLSGGIAGVAGAVVVLLLAGGLAHAVRRRDTPSSPDRSDAGRDRG